MQLVIGLLNLAGESVMLDGKECVFSAVVRELHTTWIRFSNKLRVPICSKLKKPM